MLSEIFFSEDVFLFLLPFQFFYMLKYYLQLPFNWLLYRHKQNIRQLITFTGPQFISLLHLVPLLETRILLFNLVSSFFRAIKTFWFDLIWSYKFASRMDPLLDWFIIIQDSCSFCLLLYCFVMQQMNISDKKKKTSDLKTWNCTKAHKIP